MEACVCSAAAPTYFPAYKLDKRENGIVEQATGDTIILAEDASTTDDVYKNMEIRIISGKGNGKIRTIKKYIGLTRQALINSPWEKIPDTTSSYSIKSIYSAIDGGVAANNPSSCAVAEALRLGYSVDEITILSISTGDRTRVIPFEKAQHWGLVQWAQPLIGVLLDASSEVYEYITFQIMRDRMIAVRIQT
ncbi:MAG: hypothetical protein ACHBN1_35755 [Heteroscytonema crispum UTEX LB 1556]